MLQKTTVPSYKNQEYNSFVYFSLICFTLCFQQRVSVFFFFFLSSLIFWFSKHFVSARMHSIMFTFLVWSQSMYRTHINFLFFIYLWSLPSLTSLLTIFPLEKALSLRLPITYPSCYVSLLCPLFIMWVSSYFSG